MATSRTSIIRGPGTATFGTGANAVKIFDASGITAELNAATQEIPSSVSGTLDTITTDQTGIINLTPCGQISPALLAVLFPHQTPVIGSSIFGSEDTPLEIVSVAGTSVLFRNAALTGAPELRLSPVATAFGQATFTALVGMGMAPEDANAICTIAAKAYADGNPSNIGLSGCKYTAAWAGLEIPDTTEGWTVTVELNIEAVVVDSVGTIDYTLSGVTVRARCTPVGLTEAQILAALPITKARGSSTSTEHDLVISAPAPGLTVTLKRAALVQGPLAWGNTTLRVGEIGFVAHRAFNEAGAPGQLYSVVQTGATQE